mmetsp:Transcript_44648/g.123746  ORF Transcript_44648/g.123746 Transcript_44648/m.123746 type:complete len:434 (+) Transcript_44648:59-1360(+)
MLPQVRMLQLDFELELALLLLERGFRRGWSSSGFSLVLLPVLLLDLDTASCGWPWYSLQSSLDDCPTRWSNSCVDCAARWNMRRNMPVPNSPSWGLSFERDVPLFSPGLRRGESSRVFHATVGRCFGCAASVFASYLPAGVVLAVGSGCSFGVVASSSSSHQPAAHSAEGSVTTDLYFSLASSSSESLDSGSGAYGPWCTCTSVLDFAGGGCRTSDSSSLAGALRRSSISSSLVLRLMAPQHIAMTPMPRPTIPSAAPAYLRIFDEARCEGVSRCGTCLLAGSGTSSSSNPPSPTSASSSTVYSLMSGVDSPSPTVPTLRLPRRPCSWMATTPRRASTMAYLATMGPPRVAKRCRAPRRISLRPTSAPPRLAFASLATCPRAQGRGQDAKGGAATWSLRKLGGRLCAGGRGEGCKLKGEVAASPNSERTPDAS